MKVILDEIRAAVVCVYTFIPHPPKSKSSLVTLECYFTEFHSKADSLLFILFQFSSEVMKFIICPALYMVTYLSLYECTCFNIQFCYYAPKMARFSMQQQLSWLVAM